MGKRSRDASFSPATEDASYPTSESQAPSDTETTPPGKIKLIDVSPPALTAGAVMQCSLPPHRSALAFKTIEEFEIHYAKEHTNRCSSCGKNFPTAHFLALHIDETHNALREALQAKGEKTYACFVEDCDRKCSTPQKRRLHLIDKHMFPKDYNFRITVVGIDKSTSMLKEGQRRRVSTSENQKESFGHRRRTSSGNLVAQSASTNHPEAAHKVQKERSDLIKRNNLFPQGVTLQRIDESGSHQRSDDEPDVDELERSMSALKFIPNSVLRQQGRHKAAD